jgi:hypothetical protein
MYDDNDHTTDCWLQARRSLEDKEAKVKRLEAEAKVRCNCDFGVRNSFDSYQTPGPES